MAPLVSANTEKIQPGISTSPSNTKVQAPTTERLVRPCIHALFIYECIPPLDGVRETDIKGTRAMKPKTELRRGIRSGHNSFPYPAVLTLNNSGCRGSPRRHLLTL